MSIQSKLIVDDRVSNVLKWNFAFDQKADYNNRPSGKPIFKGISITLEADKNTDLMEWMISPNMTKQFELHLTPTTFISKTRKLLFNDAHCIEYKLNYNSDTKRPLSIELFITAAGFKDSLTGAEHSEYWRVTYPNTTPLTNIEQEEPIQRNISVKSFLKNGTIVPLGIKDYNGKSEENNLNFDIEVMENPAEKMLIEVRKSGSTIYSEEITKGDMLSVGIHEWKWDGFDNNDNLNTYSLKNDPLSLKVTVWFEEKEEYNILSIDNIVAKKVEWVDVDIQRNIKQMVIYLKINLRDGGEKGINKAKNIPENVIEDQGFEPISKRTKNYNELEGMALSGINKYWSRTADNVTETLINGEDWKISVIATADDKGMKAPKIIYFTNSKETNFTRSHNWELSRKLFYKVGYLKYDDWVYQNNSYANEDFIETSAHEIGHEILLAYGGQSYSKEHKDTSDLLQNVTNENSYPKIGEIDLMKYYDGYRPNDFYERRVASAKDVISLIWLSKLEIR